MKKVILPFALFLAMLVGLYYSTKYTNNTCDKLLEIAYETESSIAFEQWDNAYINSMVLLTSYEKDMSIVTLFLNHEELDIIYNETLKLTQYTKEEDKTHSLSSIHLVKSLIEGIKEGQKITLRNVL
ncbi:hypothetical protein U732_2013 [Clostridium argentinense CDC 2741]|uniref:DUF4363 family protein n=1 Tax=Clostridium argentinense CDC 2741 TaxID=1418104 RepID=A0A0C1R738_9CLOT|nr:DUF4363 family protein [Clostridium argentinense]ARC85788.1 hypothetical protein RSJ17_15460 [Clostridium argentinense]KIE46306.1 hypothetical protein U732_2013 [Clostridium argentinense CDC 2741]NFF39871.1 DUF4363 family protein [Clostridium argentinense]NFP51026.1 DUF4363 family protein [Clostridium argentinense]NFP73158.1 DUF4363 family protein [Clostridium argentinense]